MRYRKLGRSGLIVSELCLGSNGFGGADDPFWKQYGGLDRSAVNAVVAAAIAGGVSFFDTADGYTNGDAERLLGGAIRDLALVRSNVHICTKVGTQSGTGPNGCGGSRSHLIDACEKSLKRLNTDFIDVYLLHWFDMATPIEETLRAFDDLVRAGKVRYVGCSNFAAWEAMKAVGISERERLERFTVVQNHWSIATRDIEREMVPFARSEGLGIMAFGSLLAGVLTGKYDRQGASDRPGRFNGKIPEELDKDRVHRIVDVLRAVSQAHEVSPAEIAIAFLLREKSLASVIFGSTKPEQVTANIRASDITFSDEDLAALENASAMPIDFGANRTAPARRMRLQYLSQPNT